MPYAISKPTCVSCFKPIADVAGCYFKDGRSHGLGLVCADCRPLTEGYREVIFHAFGGVHDDEARHLEPKAPYHVPALQSVGSLRALALESAKRHEELRKFLAPVDRQIIEADAV